jgi:hypothetical protein
MSQREIMLEAELIDDRLNFKERMGFQVELMITMLGGQKTLQNMDIEEKRKIELEWADKYAYKVSLIIDNPKNVEIREQILKHNYEKAVNLILPLLEIE